MGDKRTDDSLVQFIFFKMKSIINVLSIAFNYRENKSSNPITYIQILVVHCIKCDALQRW
jgi:hypothetical protein